MRLTGVLALLLFLVMGSLALKQIGSLESSLTTLTGGPSEFVVRIPTLFIILFAQSNPFKARKKWMQDRGVT